MNRDNPFSVENTREMANTMKAILVEIRESKTLLLEAKKELRKAREDLRNLDKLKPLKEATIE